MSQKWRSRLRTVSPTLITTARNDPKEHETPCGCNVNIYRSFRSFMVPVLIFSLQQIFKVAFSVSGILTFVAKPKASQQETSLTWKYMRMNKQGYEGALLRCCFDVPLHCPAWWQKKCGQLLLLQRPDICIVEFMLPTHCNQSPKSTEVFFTSGNLPCFHWYGKYSSDRFLFYHYLWTP